MVRVYWAPEWTAVFYFGNNCRFQKCQHWIPTSCLESSKGPSSHSMACCRHVFNVYVKFCIFRHENSQMLDASFLFCFSPGWIVVYCLFLYFPISHVFKLSTIEVHVVLLCPSVHVLKLLLKDVCTKISFDHLPESGVVRKLSDHSC